MKVWPILTQGIPTLELAIGLDLGVGSHSDAAPIPILV